MPPEQVVDALAGLATSSPAGNGSESSSEVTLSVLALLSIDRVNVDTPPCRALLGENDLLNTGGTPIIRSSLAVPLEPSEEVSSPVTFG